MSEPLIAEVVDVVPVPEKRNSADTLENFARRIEERIRIGRDNQPFALERLICRLLTGKDLKVAAVMASRLVEWKYGKAKETVVGRLEGEASLKILVEHIGPRTENTPPAETDKTR